MTQTQLCLPKRIDRRTQNVAVNKLPSSSLQKRLQALGWVNRKVKTTSLLVVLVVRLNVPAQRAQENGSDGTYVGMKRDL